MSLASASGFFVSGGVGYRIFIEIGPPYHGQGKVAVAENKYYAISLASPVGNALLNKSVETQCNFRKRSIRFRGCIWDQVP